MRKIFVLFLSVLMLVSAVACGVPNIDGELLKEMQAHYPLMTGNFIVDGKTYTPDDVHKQLVDAGWISDGCGNSILTPEMSNTVFYYSEKYGTDLMDFHIAVFYYNDGKEDKVAKDCPLQAVLIEANENGYPEFGVTKDINSSATSQEVEKKYRPHSKDGNRFLYSGDANTGLTRLIITGDKNGKIKSFELLYR